MQIDVRNQPTNPEDVPVRFGETEYLIYAGDDLGFDMDRKGFYIKDTQNGSSVCLYIDDIDNLIIALQKAKELWSK